MEGLARRVCIKMSTKAIKWRRSGEAFSTCDISQHLADGVTNWGLGCEEFTVTGWGREIKMHIAESSCIYFPLFCCRQEAADIHFRRCRRTFFIMHRVKHGHTPDFHEVLMMQETLFITKITLRADMLSKIQNVAFEPLIKTMKTVTMESLQVCCSVVNGKQCIFLYSKHFHLSQ